jgi:hypothetical protein
VTTCRPSKRSAARSWRGSRRAKVRSDGDG